MGLIWYPGAWQQTLSAEVIKLKSINSKISYIVILFALSTSKCLLITLARRSAGNCSYIFWLLPLFCSPEQKWGFGGWCGQLSVSRIVKYLCHWCKDSSGPPLLLAQVQQHRSCSQEQASTAGLLPHRVWANIPARSMMALCMFSCSVVWLRFHGRR